VRDYLAARGVSPARIQIAGRGEREPVADNSTEAGRAKNRRVEIFLREPAA
jgi:outer membrane protein OmpA-like peptidoglycan-associated protein